MNFNQIAQMTNEELAENVIVTDDLAQMTTEEVNAIRFDAQNAMEIFTAKAESYPTPIKHLDWERKTAVRKEWNRVKTLRRLIARIDAFIIS